MVKGLDCFREYFKDFSDQYVLIGGSACDISFDEGGADFRATKDLDMISLSVTVKEEMATFIQSLREECPDLKALGLRNVKLKDIIRLLEETYCR